MKLIIMSDSHLKNDTVFKIIEHHPEADYYIHCGDVGKDINQEQVPHFYIVKGNNDYSDFPLELLLEIENQRYFISHGDRYNVDDSLDTLLQIAKEKQANYVLYGHTHNPSVQVIDGITLINPGSITFPRGGKIFVPSYCVLEDNEIHFYHAKTFASIDDLFEPRKRTSLFKKLFHKE